LKRKAEGDVPENPQLDNSIENEPKVVPNGRVKLQRISSKPRVEWMKYGGYKIEGAATEDGLTGGMNPTVVAMVEKEFPGAMPEEEFIDKLLGTLHANNIEVGEKTLLATSLCCDEVNRSLTSKLTEVFGQNFAMGGLAGFPFGGITSFGAYSHHIPKPGGTAVMVFAPHVGVDATGVVGKVDRRGMPNSGVCCGSACAALGLCKELLKKEPSERVCPPQVDFYDAQQAWVGQALLPNAEEVINASNPMAELPRALFKSQKEAVEKIITRAAPGNVPDNTPVTVAGGIQINTPAGTPDFFLPLMLELRSETGEVQKDMLSELTESTAVISDPASEETAVTP